MRLWEENGFQVSEQYASNHYRVVKNDEGCEKYMDRLAQKQKEGYEIKSPRPKDFRRTLREAYGLMIEGCGSLPACKRITEAEFRRQFKYLKSILNYSMVKLAYYQGEAVGFFISVPNLGNAVYGKVQLWQLPSIHSQKKKPKSYIMLYMGVDPKHKELGKALAEAIRCELKLQQVPSVGILVRSGDSNKDYMGHLIDYECEYVLLERQV